MNTSRNLIGTIEDPGKILARAGATPKSGDNSKSK